MPLRGYRPGYGDPATDAMRARIVAAARALLCEGERPSELSIDTTAARAGAARVNVYQQFGSAAGVFEALFDSLVERGGLERLPEACAQPDPLRMLDQVIAVYAGFWNIDREAFRRIYALSAFDAELARALQLREGYRRRGIGALSRQLSERGLPVGDEARELLLSLTSFAVLDRLAGPERELLAAVPLAQRTARAALAGAGD